MVIATSTRKAVRIVANIARRMQVAATCRALDGTAACSLRMATLAAGLTSPGEIITIVEAVLLRQRLGEEEVDHRLLALADRQSGEQIVITLWESEEAMRASEDAANRIREEGLTEGEEVASVGRYEVTMDERN